MLLNEYFLSNNGNHYSYIMGSNFCGGIFNYIIFYILSEISFYLIFGKAGCSSYFLDIK
jgi:hypothetical protein